MAEHKVDREVLLADLDWILGADEAEVATELRDEPSKVAKERAVEIRLGVSVREAEELDAVGVLELVEGCWMGSCHRWRHFLRGPVAAERDARVELTLKLALAPPSLDRREHVELALLRVLRLAEDDQVMGPWQLCHQR